MKDDDAEDRHHGVSFPLEEPDDYLRVRIERDNHGRIFGFLVQYETRIGGAYLAVTRYDTFHGFHGFPHQDILDRQGNVVEKRWLYHLGVVEALNYADDDLKRFWRQYKATF